jgi:NADH:ubiquinone oxidoreductase subunit
MSEFKSMADLINKTKRTLDNLSHEVVANVVYKLDRRSPVGWPVLWKTKYPPKYYKPGHFRGNWQLGVDTNPSGEVEGYDPSGSRTVSANIAKIPSEASGHVYHIVNNVPYARKLEEGEHSSQVEPNGMVGLTSIEFESDVKRIAKRVVNMK